jgi:hypothetical protein
LTSFFIADAAERERGGDGLEGALLMAILINGHARACRLKATTFAGCASPM